MIASAETVDKSTFVSDGFGGLLRCVRDCLLECPNEIGIGWGVAKMTSSSSSSFSSAAATISDESVVVLAVVLADDATSSRMGLLNWSLLSLINNDADADDVVGLSPHESVFRRLLLLEEHPLLQ